MLYEFYDIESLVLVTYQLKSVSILKSLSFEQTHAKSAAKYILYKEGSKEHPSQLNTPDPNGFLYGQPI